MNKCKHCGKDFLPKICGRPGVRSQLFCTRNCSSLDRQKRWKAGNQHIALKLPRGTVGAIHELVVATDLLKMGFHVFRSLSPACPCDLAILSNNKLIRVEVTTGYRSIGGNIQHNKKDIGKFDILAVVEHNGTITYSGNAVHIIQPA